MNIVGGATCGRGLPRGDVASFGANPRGAFGDESAKLANLTPETDLFSTAVVWIRTKTVQRFFRVSRLLAGLGAGRSTATGGTAPLSRPLDKYNLQVNKCQLVYNSARCDCRAG